MQDLIRELTSGRIEGVRASEGRVAGFLGVPYGCSVSGGQRFLPASPVEAWSGVRDATSVGPAAPQPPMVFDGGPRSKRMSKLIAELTCTEAQGEECLVLNVWEPTSSSTTRRPVMVSIHGGAHTIGSGSMPVYDGASLADRQDVVVVSVNHRLGALGYLYLEEVLGEKYRSSSNAGNLDLVLALEWVRDNAEAFGGDPLNVTVFGESGGGAKISTLLAMPAAAGLFQRAIIQSGPKLRALSPKAAAATTRALLEELDLVDNPEGLLSVSAEVLIEAQVRVLGGPLGFGPLTFGPVVDGVDLPHHPFDPAAPAISAAVPVLIGSTKDEMSFFTYPNEDLDDLDDEGAIAAIAPVAGDRARDVYGIYAQAMPEVSPTVRLAAMLTARFRFGSTRLAERKAALQEAPVWMYRFDFETDVEDGALGAPHAIDVAFTFGNPDATPLSGSRPERFAVADLACDVWGAFARHGTPQITQLPEWPPYDDRRRATMLLDVEPRVVDDPESEQRQAWDGIVLPT